MNLSRIIRAVTVASLIGTGGTAAVSAQEYIPAPTGQTELQILQMEQKLKAALAARDEAAVAALHWDNLIDIHASGWIYTKEQSIELRNLSATPGGQGPGRKVIKASDIDWKVVKFTDDVGLVTGMSETYYEVPNPQSLAIAAGTLTRSTPAQRAALRAAAPTPGPGEALSPNPYRVRMLRLWVRKGGEWRIAISNATRISERVTAGR